MAFKKRLAEHDSRTTGGKLSKATLYATLAHLKRFFEWLAGQPGYKSRLQYSDAEYFGLSLKDARVASSRREKPVPTLEHIRHAISMMPGQTEIERRNRALMSFALLTGARDSALASMKLKQVDLAAGSVFQDAREVDTKFSKCFTAYFFAVGAEVRQIFDDWVNYLRQEKLWGNDDPLFPATLVELGESRQFEAVGLARRHWSTALPIRAIFRGAFLAAGLPYFNPQSFRNTLVQLGQTLCRDAEQFKAWSQNMGHDGVLTTFLSYGAVAPRRQGQIIQALGLGNDQPAGQAEVVVQAVVQGMRGAGLLAQQG